MTIPIIEETLKGSMIHKVPIVAILEKIIVGKVILVVRSL